MAMALLVWQCQDQANETLPNASSAPSGGKGSKTQMSTPALAVATSEFAPTQLSINIVVTAGATGAPAGFSLQWMTAADYATNGGWYASDDARLCKGSFSGNANMSRYNLGANESVTVSIGEFLFDNGASTNCGGALECGTRYVFRAFAHASATLQRSDFTSNLEASTLSCGNTGEGCTLTQGYWKNHGEVEGCTSPSGKGEWPVNELTLGEELYSAADICTIMHTPAAGNALLALAHQLVAAKFNVLNNADASAIAGTIADADAFLARFNSKIAPVGNASQKSSALIADLINKLARYNEGGTGPGHCDN